MCVVWDCDEPGLDPVQIVKVSKTPPVSLSGHRRKERAAIVAKVERHTSEPDLVSLFDNEFPRNWG